MRRIGHLSNLTLLAWGIAAGPGCGDAAPPDLEPTDVSSSTSTTGDLDPSTTTPMPTTLETGNTTGTESGNTEPPPPVYRVEIDAEASTVQFFRDEDRLLGFAADAFGLGLVAEIDDTKSYDPVFPLEVDWVQPSAFTSVAADPLAVRIEYGEMGSALLSVSEVAEGRFSAHWEPDGLAQPVAAFRLRATVDAQEGFYGLGEVFDEPNHRGHVRPMQIELDLTVESSTNEAHVPVPLLIGTRGWGLFVEDPHPAVFNVATDAADEVEVIVGVGPHGDDGIDFHLFGSVHPLDITAHYYAMTGDPIRPAPWALGPWLWRNENVDQAQVISDANMLRTLDLPTSGLWIDRPYATGVNTFDFDPARYDDPATMIESLQGLGLRVALWHTPYASDDREAALDIHAEAVAMGYYPPTAGPSLQDWGLPIDLTNPDAYDWWQALIGNYTDLGIEGYKLDFAEDIVPGVGGARFPWVFDDGSDERTMHALYQPLYHRVYAETLPDDGGFLLARAGTYGDQTNVSVIWPGDLNTDFSRHREDLGSSLAVGGLPAAVAAGSSLGPAGFPLFASDTGGFRDGPPNREAMIRWFQHTALTVVMQVGTGTSDVVWEFNEENGFDDAMVDLFREFSRLHIRLFPYLWTHVHRVTEDGRPIVRALGLAHPELGAHPPFDYLLGDDLLVAPVVDEGARERSVTWPEGEWIDWFDGTRVTGPQTATVDAPLAKLPLYLRRGGIVPMLRPTVDTLSPTTQPAMVDSYADEPGRLFVRAFTGASPSRFELFDGTVLEQSQVERAATVRLAAGTRFAEGFELELVGNGDAETATLDGELLPERSAAELDEGLTGWADDPGLPGGGVRVVIPAGDHAVEVTYVGGS